jgi:hypothetical protein
VIHLTIPGTEELSEANLDLVAGGMYWSDSRRATCGGGG